MWECSSRTSGLLSQGVSAGALGRTKIVSRFDQAGRADGRQISLDPRKSVPALPLYALQRVRTAGGVSAQPRAGPNIIRCDTPLIAGSDHPSPILQETRRRVWLFPPTRPPPPP